MHFVYVYVHNCHFTLLMCIAVILHCPQTPQRVRQAKADDITHCLWPQQSQGTVRHMYCVLCIVYLALI